MIQYLIWDTKKARVSSGFLFYLTVQSQAYFIELDISDICAATLLSTT